MDGQRAAYLALHELAHELSGGRWVATGGGGYALVDVVPRAWSHLLSVVSGAPLDVVDARRRRPGVRTCGSGSASPPRGSMGDGRTPEFRDRREGYDPDTWLDREIDATRTAVFPLLGLDPLP